jgi:hypothetical protein
MKSKVLLAGLVALAAMAATVSAASVVVPPLPKATPAVWQNLELQRADFPAGTSIPAETSFVIGTDGAYRAFVNGLSPSGANGASFPNVDFAKQFLVVASYGVKDLGNAMTITGARTDGAHVVVYLNQQADNPNHCRLQHNVHFIGQLAIVQRSGGADVTQDGSVGFVTSASVAPYNDYFNCGCPEMGTPPTE